MNNFYEENHQSYFASTVDIDPSAFLEPLARQLKPKATVLDIGCGSGRDLLWLAKRGFRPTGFEQSPGLASMARKHAGCPVIEGDFTLYDFSGLQFSALVFVGSLVHLSHEAYPAVLKSTFRALVPGGIVLITMKEGDGTTLAADGRVFTLWARQDIEQIFAMNQLHTLDFSRQTSKIRPSDIWLGYVLRYGNDR
ncbi:class I SAM-dependent methyltransferase [Desulfobulbus alkaliphilus]|uniref:class I SAM-dependent methyltransferase n=1 Tax=Desulfobulbus alkaliphilus TaxID=869814 RepID=UPI00196277B6|nr:class I SAM-dependent methyltransferase [Desulfobulbus alkaliphilus]MBM9536743.1 class I SAM-dependent methyltransferase [Desulfobulbus alkaliphilus]